MAVPVSGIRLIGEGVCVVCVDGKIDVDELV